MAHEVLISYSRHDKLQADAICNRLESQGIRCWIAPRDVPAGTEYADSIVNAIENAQVLLLVYSSNADQSKQVKREVERAVSEGIKILPVRIEDAEMSKSFEYYVGSIHWLDAITPPLEAHIDRLARDLKALLAKDDEPSPATETAPQPEPSPPPETARPASSASPPPAAPAPSPRAAAPPPEAPASKKGRGPIVLAAVAAIAVLAVVVWYLMGSSSSDMTAELASLGETSYQSLVEACEQEESWQWGCEVPAIPDIEPFIDGNCACDGRILRHHDTGLFRCEALPSTCGGVSFEATLGYAPEMDWYEDVTPR